MSRAKSAFGVIGALLPVVYCGGLVFYFLDRSGSVEGAEAIGLGPTLLGLGLLGLLFSIPLLWKIVRMFSGPGAPGPLSGDAEPDSPPGGDTGRLNADEVIARYMAQPAGEGAGSALPVPAARTGDTAPARPVFGRRTGTG